MRGILSVLFGDGIRVLEDPDSSCSGTLSGPASGQRCLVLPFDPGKPGQKSLKKVARKWPVLSLFALY